MKLIIFGASNGVGHHVMAQALEQGHHVTAFARHAGGLGQTHDNMTAINGDALDPDAVADAVAGQDAVVCTLGAGLTSADGVRARGTANILRAMEKKGVGRLVCLSGFGAGDSRHDLPFFYRHFVIPVILRRVYADHERQEGFVKTSAADWTLVRPVNLTDGPRTGTYRHGNAPGAEPLGMRISRGDVAEFMLKQLTDDTYRHKAPFLSS